ncbi:MAG: helix-turn-helix domain-containing protein [Chitinophagaceae bacterium]
MQTDTSNINFQLAADFINYTNRSVFLTGKAGTGKTTFLKYIREHSNKQIAVVAPTGVAAINAGGVTIHSFFQLPFTPYVPAKVGFSAGNERVTDKHQLFEKVKLNKERIGIIQKLELLIIDEISMVRCDVLDAIDQVLRHYRNQHYKPFGGLQVLLIGDMFQLPPVVPNEEWQLLSQYYASPYFFDSMVIKEGEPAYIELNKIYRQDDELFIDLLNKIRNNNMDEDAFELLQKHYNPEFQPRKDEGYITLTTHNARADAINSEALNSLTTPSYFFKAIVETEFSEKMFPVDEVLELKLGSQVMFTKNDLDKSKRYFNGKIGTITEIGNDNIVVKCNDDNASIKVEKYRWENIKYSLNPQKQQVEEDVIGTFTQYPLRLAWAITIHKSQGLTFDKAIIDAGKAFAPGQVYVALSRCRTIDGIVLVSKIGNQSLHNDEHIKTFSKQYKNSQLNESLEFEKHLHQNEILQELFTYNNEVKICDKLKTFIQQTQNSFNAGTVDFINSLNDKVNLYNRYGVKFKQELTDLDINNILPEANSALQDRFKKAAIFFSNELENFSQQINACNAITDNKEYAKTFTETLKNLFVEITTKQFVMHSLQTGFVFSEYQKAKKNFITPQFNFNANSKKSASSQHTSNPDLYEALRDLRNEICEATGEEVFMIAGSKSLEEMATYLPHTKSELMQITGFGKAKVEKYGLQFLELIVTYCNHKNLSSLVNTKTKSERDKIKTDNEKPKTAINKIDTKEFSFNLFKQGKTIVEIAKERSMVVGTIEGHLTPYIATGRIAINEVMTIEKAAKIIKALEGFDRTTSITPMQAQLGDDYSFAEIRMVLAHLDFVNSKSIAN